MISLDTVPIPTGYEVKEKLNTASFRDIVPKLITPEALQQGWVECSQTEIINTIFNGSTTRAHYFLEQLQKRPEVKVLRHPENTLWCLDVSGWNGTHEFSMKVLLEPDALKQQVAYEAEDIYLINNSTGTAVSLQSLLPIYQGAAQHIPIDFRLIFRNPTTPADEKELSLKNLYSFSAGEGLTLGEVHQVDQVRAILHEAGHIWTYYLRIFSRTHRQSSTNGSSFSFSNDAQEHGSAAALQLASEIGFNERMANFIGKILDIKLAKSGFYAAGQRKSWVQAIDANGSTYDASHAMLHLENYNAVRPAFVSRFHRTEVGRNHLVQEAAWMKDKIDVFLLWTERLPANNMVKRRYLDRVISEWQSKTAQGTFRCTVKRDLAGIFRSAEVVWETGSRKIQVSLTDFHGVSFFDSAIDPTIRRYIEVGREYTDLAERKQQFESTLRQLVNLQLT
jgi:hypothetical protein